MADTVTIDLPLLPEDCDYKPPLKFEGDGFTVHPCLGDMWLEGVVAIATKYNLKISIMGDGRIIGVGEDLRKLRSLLLST